jgi:hypothetical protein
VVSSEHRNPDKAVKKAAKIERNFYTNWTPAALLRQFIEDEIECRADSDSYYAPNFAQAMKSPRKTGTRAGQATRQANNGRKKTKVFRLRIVPDCWRLTTRLAVIRRVAHQK